MRALGIVLSMAVAFVLIGAGSAQEKKPTNKEKLIGTWEVVKAPKGWKYFNYNVPPKSTVTMEFTKDSKLKFLLKDGDAATSQHDTYSVDGDTVTITQKQGDKDVTRTVMITKVTDKELVFRAKDGDKATTIQFKRK